MLFKCRTAVQAKAVSDLSYNRKPGSQILGQHPSWRSEKVVLVDLKYNFLRIDEAGRPGGLVVALECC